MPHQQERVLDEAIAALHRTTGIAAQVLEHEPGGGGGKEDALIEVEVGQQRHLYLAEVKTVDRFDTPAQVKRIGTTWKTPPILVAPYITRATADRCRELRLPFIDAAGNAYLEGLGFLLYVVGNHRRIRIPQERLRAVTPAGLRITFAMLCHPELLQANYRNIAAHAGVALGTVGPVLKDLERRGLIRFTDVERGRILDPRRLLRDWVMHYQTTLRPKLKQRRFEADAERMAALDVRKYNAYWGGEMGADRLTHMLKPIMFTLYAREPIAELIAANRMRAKEDGNVEILEVYWNFPVPEDHPDVVPPPLVYADLLATQDGRNVEVAQLVYEQYMEPSFG